MGNGKRWLVAKPQKRAFKRCALSWTEVCPVRHTYITGRSWSIEVLRSMYIWMFSGLHTHVLRSRTARTAAMLASIRNTTTAIRKENVTVNKSLCNQDDIENEGTLSLNLPILEGSAPRWNHCVNVIEEERSALLVKLSRELFRRRSLFSIIISNNRKSTLESSIFSYQ